MNAKKSTTSTVTAPDKDLTKVLEQIMDEEIDEVLSRMDDARHNIERHQALMDSNKEHVVEKLHFEAIQSVLYKYCFN